MAGIDGGDQDEVRRRWVSGAMDAERRSDTEKRLLRARERLVRAEKEGHAPTVAAAHVLVADSLDDLTFSPREETFREAVEAWRRARKLWPEVGIEPGLAGGLEALAVWSALPSSPALKRAWDEQRRRLLLPDVDDWVFARLAGDAALEGVAARAFARTDLRLASEIDVRLDPGDEREKADLDLLRSAGAQ